MNLDVGPDRAWTHGRVTGFVARHRLEWELGTAALTLAYVVLAFLQDQGSSRLVTFGVGGLAAAFIVEFTLRVYDSPSRKSYLRRHWLDIVTCLPVIGPFRLLRLVRLVGFIRLGAAARAYGVGAAASDRLPGGIGLWVLAPILITVWLASSYAYYELESGVNPHIKTFGDALFYAFMTASTVGYGAVTPVTEEGKVLTGLLIFLSIGLLGFASAQLTAKLLPQHNEVAELKATINHQVDVLEELKQRFETMAAVIEQRPHIALSVDESADKVSQLV